VLDSRVHNERLQKLPGDDSTISGEVVEDSDRLKINSHL
jgi:hypothetical protein